MNLLSFRKPSRYINGEINAIHKTAPLRVALAFPDVYEVGMSHLGLKILYDMINRIPYASAERVFSPWLDLDEGMRRSGAFLSSLESGLPLKEFDLVGFSLQYELSYTTVLNMLHLGGMPVRADERLGRADMPLVLAGGPCTLNPLPMSAFADAFLIGDGEEAVPEILEILYRWKAEGSKDKEVLLRELAGVGGIYVPLLKDGRKVRRRLIRSLEDAPFPDSPVLPFTGIVHDRVNIEIARGCSMGCRFCQAGMAYRPVRERSPGRVLDLAERSLKNTGYEDISFTSLSSGDYSCLSELLSEFNRRFSGSRISVSLPSLRVASVNREMLRQIKAVRKTGFTIAPEAGTDRLRSVINKDFSEETYVSALETLFREGWNNLKLYFMTGLPTETDEDIEGIHEMVLQAIRISKRLTGRHVNISVGVSSFIPKPHTPFQWFGQRELSALKERNSYLKRRLLKRGVKVKGHAEEMSLLEAVFSRGDERLSSLIEEAWKGGCRLDAWTESFDHEKWVRAMDAAGIDAAAYAMREYEPDAALPWEIVDTGVERAYLRREYERALSCRFTSDCRKTCHGCGLACRSTGTPETRTPLPVLAPSKSAPPAQGQEVSVRLRMRYSKTGKTRYLSHLELTTALARAMRRAGFPLKYSEGFHPAPRISFGPALSVGIAGLREYLDIDLAPPFNVEGGLRGLNLTLPEGIHADAMVYIPPREKSLNSYIIRYVYEVRHAGGLSAEGFPDRAERVVRRDDLPVDMNELVEELVRVDDVTFRLTVTERGQLKVRLSELLPEIFGLPVEELEVTRLEMFGWDGRWITPLGNETIWTAKS